MLVFWPAASAAQADPAARFGNLQVLPEDASASEVFQVMKLMTRALGTDCRACHRTAEREFDSDEMPLKATARAMMLLEQARRADLNWRDPPPDLCVECHQGQLRPLTATEAKMQ